MVALGAWAKERSSNAAINVVAREMALDLAEGLYKGDVKQHLAGRLSLWADAFGRLSQPGSGATVPPALRCVERVPPASRGAGKEFTLPMAGSRWVVSFPPNLIVLYLSTFLAFLILFRNNFLNFESIISIYDPLRL